MGALLQKPNDRASLYGIYLMKAVYDLAGSFIAIFIPLFLLQKDLNIAHVFTYYVVFALFIPIFFFAADGLVNYMGLKKTALASYPFLFLYFYLLYNMDKYGVPLYLISIISALATSFYWYPLNIWLTNTSRVESLGGDLSKFFMASNILSVFLPIISAVIVVYYGFKNIFIISSVLYFISIIPILYLPEFESKGRLKFDQFKKLLTKYPRYFVAEILVNMKEEAEGRIWPVFVYLSFMNVLSIGYLGTIGAIGSITFMFFVGRYTDKIDKRKLLGYGSVILAIIWFARFFTITPLIAYVLTLTVSFFDVLILIPMRTVVYSIAKHEGPHSFILFREFANAGGRILLYFFAFLMISSIKYIFICIALVCVALLYVTRRELELKETVS